MSDAKDFALAVIVGVVLGLFISAWPYAAQRADIAEYQRTINRLETEIARSKSALREARAEVTTLRGRNRQAQDIVRRAGAELPELIGNAQDIGRILDYTISVIERIEVAIGDDGNGESSSASTE